MRTGAERDAPALTSTFWLESNRLSGSLPSELLQLSPSLSCTLQGASAVEGQSNHFACPLPTDAFQK